MNIYQDVERILSNTEYAILHGWQSLPDHHDSDLDIAINPDHLNILEESLADFKSGKLVQLLQHESSCFYFILAHKNGKGMEFLQVDAATDYRRNGLTYFSAEELSRARQQWKGFWVASPETELAYLLVKKTLKGETPGHQKKRLRYLIDKLGEEKSTVISTELFGKESGPRIISWISNNNWSVQESNLPRLKRALILETVKKDPLNPLRYWLNEAKRIVRRWLYPTGLFIAVLGPDGVGKSTLIESMEVHLSGAFRRTANFHLRPGVFGKNDQGNPVTDPHGKPPRSFPVSVLKIAYYFTDYALGYLFKLYPKFVRSTLVIFDRYYDDILVDPTRYRYSGPSWLVKFMRYFIPRPDLFLVLDASEDELLRRKQEVGKEELTRQRKAYRDLAVGLPNAFILDSSQNSERLAGDVSEIILDYLHERYMTRRELFFPNNNGDKTFAWLTSVLSADPDKCFFTIGNNRSKDVKSDLETYYKFNYLPVKDGRSYLLPLNRGSAANGLALYNAQTKKAKALKAFLKKPFIDKFGGILMKSASIVTTNDFNTRDKHDLILFEYLKKLLKLKNLDFAISLGTPGPHRKPVIQINKREGVIAGYAKVGWNEATNSLVKNEADTLQNLSVKSFDSFDTPSVLHTDRWHGRYVTILSTPEGNLLPAPDALNCMYMNVVNDLVDLNILSMPIRESAFWANFLNRVKRVRNSYYRNILEQKGIPWIETSLCNMPLPFHTSHGDLAPWNAYIKDGKLFLYDWEYSRPDAPVGWDLFHFTTQTNFLLKKRNSRELYNTILNDTYNGLTKPYWEKLGIGEDTMKALFLLYILEKLSFAASEEAENLKKLNQLSKIVFLIINE
jgi:thymidylate kinase